MVCVNSGKYDGLCYVEVVDVVVVDLNVGGFGDK